jgi:hypothetical protein
VHRTFNLVCNRKDNLTAVSSVCVFVHVCVVLVHHSVSISCVCEHCNVFLLRVKHLISEFDH